MARLDLRLIGPYTSSGLIGPVFFSFITDLWSILQSVCRNLHMVMLY